MSTNINPLADFRVETRGRGRSYTSAMAVFQQVSLGKPDDEIMEKLSISKKALSQAKATIAAIAPERAKEFWALSESPRRFLVDECLSPRLAFSIAQNFGYTSHVNFEGIIGAQDDAVHAYLRERDFTAIFTRDSANRGRGDLTVIASRCALEFLKNNDDVNPEAIKAELKSLPLIIRFYSIGDRFGAYETALEKNHDKINEAIEAKNMPYITVTKGEVHPSISFDEMAEVVQEISDILRYGVAPTEHLMRHYSKKISQFSTPNSEVA